jgi:DNA-directed RNA polymerase specialized sigma subunit
MSEQSEQNLNKMPEEFSKIIRDFITDIQTTFPEINPLIKKWWKDKSVFEYIENLEEREKQILNKLRHLV